MDIPNKSPGIQFVHPRPISGPNLAELRFNDPSQAVINYEGQHEFEYFPYGWISIRSADMCYSAPKLAKTRQLL